MNRSLTVSDAHASLQSLFDAEFICPIRIGRAANAAYQLIRHCRPEVDERPVHPLQADLTAFIAIGKIVECPTALVRSHTRSLLIEACEASDSYQFTSYKYALRLFGLLDAIRAQGNYPPSQQGRRHQQELYLVAWQDTERDVIRLRPANPRAKLVMMEAGNEKRLLLVA